MRGGSKDVATPITMPKLDVAPSYDPSGVRDDLRELEKQSFPTVGASFEASDGCLEGIPI